MVAAMTLALMPDFARRIADAGKHWLHKGRVTVKVKLPKLLDDASGGTDEDHLHAARASGEHELRRASEDERGAIEHTFFEDAAVDRDAFLAELASDDRPVAVFHVGSFRLVSTSTPTETTEAEAA